MLHGALAQGRLEVVRRRAQNIPPPNREKKAKRNDGGALKLAEAIPHTTQLDGELAGKTKQKLGGGADEKNGEGKLA